MRARQGEAPTTPYKYPDAGGCAIDGEPIIYEREPGSLPDVDFQKAAGKTWSWKMPNIQPNVNVFGWLMAQILGSDTWNTIPADHTIAPADDLPWLNVLKDDNLDRGTSTPTQRLLGAKIGDFEFVQESNSIAKLTISGKGCDEGAAAAALTTSVPTGDNEAPLSWASLKAGYLKIGYAGAATAQDNDVTGFKIMGKRALVETGRGTLGSNQPTDLRPGKRKDFFIEITKEFSGASAIAMYTAWKNQSTVAVEIKYLVGTYSVISGVMTGEIVGSYPPEISADETVVVATLRIKLRKAGAVPIVGWTVKDATTAAYA
jgi:hypothetical protein